MLSVSAPEPFVDSARPFVFLGGSIEMGKAEDWQTKLTNDLQSFEGTVLNPRRRDWDSSWEQKIDNLQFNEQVTWELTAQEDSDVLVYYFDPKTKSPITLMELGGYGGRVPTFVCCPDGFYRKGNVDFFCERYDILNLGSYEELVKHLSVYFNSVK